MVEFTDLERMVVLTNHVLRRSILLLPHRKLQLQLQPLTQPHLLLMQPRVGHLACRQLLIFGILQLNMLAELRVRISTLLRAVQTSVRKITEQVNNGRFSSQNVTLSMQRHRQNSGRRSEHRLTLQSAAAECLMPRNFKC